MYAVNLFSAKVPRQFDGENNSILTNDARKIGYSHGKKKKHTLTLTSHTILKIMILQKGRKSQCKS